jgi:hypothetical protein
MPGLVTVQRTLHNEAEFEACWSSSSTRPADVKITVTPKDFCIPPFGDATFGVTIDARAVPIGEARHATLRLSGPAADLHLPITIVRREPVVTLAKACDPTTFPRLTTTACQLKAVNTSFSTANVLLQDVLPARLGLVLSSVVGATPSGNGLAFSGALAGAAPPSVTIAPGTSPAGGYLPLSVFGIAPISGVGDDTITNFNVPAFVYAGETYNRVGVVSNGYLVVGGGTAADVSFLGQSFPNPAAPNNVLAPFWTDLNPPAGGAIRIGTLTDGTNTWLVVDWDAVKEFSTSARDSFQAWIRIGTAEDITFAYGPIQGNGDGGHLTVGAENRFGNRGQNYYYDGTGTLPANGTQLRVSGVPGAPGETKVVTFSASGRSAGLWTNCATLDADLFFGTNVSCVSGEVTP